MIRFWFAKILRAVFTMLGVTLVMFLLMHAIPGNPWDNYSNNPQILNNIDTNANFQKELNRRYGLNLPLWRQYLRFVIGDIEQDGSFYCGAICGDLGPSILQRGRSVQSIIFEPPHGKSTWDSRFGYSIRLVLFASLIAVGLGIPLGIWSTARPGAGIGKLITVMLAALVSIPNFVIGLLAMIVLASGLGIIKVLPDWNQPSDWIIPAVVLAIVPMANIARVTRATLINIMHEDYVRTARGKGLTENRIMRVHILNNALAPIITFLGQTFMEMFTGLLIVENLYGFPGIGRGYWEAVLQLDYPMIIGLTSIYAVGILMVNILVEFISDMLDPRIYAGRQAGISQ
ncbi:MAG: ABC transporter permease [Chloroflexi bacterium]|nr:ABC transporter permease [Chloroflexota bacterium]